MTASTETPDERAQEIVHMLTTHVWSHIEAQTTIAAAIREAVAAETAACAKVCEELGDDQYRKLASKGSNDGIARMVQKHYTESAAAIRSRRP